MNEFWIYLQLGWQHIADPNAYDHLLFLVALCVPYPLEQWRQLLVLVTAFTIGHSLTLALVALDVMTVPSHIIEFLIPVTILLTVIYNFFGERKKIDTTVQNNKMIKLNYGLALIFGLVHGMGFSNFFGELLGKSTAILKPLLAFNIGIEIGQLLIVTIIIGLTFLVTKYLKIKHQWWLRIVSGIVGLLSLQLIWATKIW